jgi:DNA-binding NarL/FixJ family response regulator
MRARRPFVGREAELVDLRHQLDYADDSVPTVVVIEGDAGIGKTALVNRFLEDTGTVHILQASGDESEMGLAYGVLDQLAGAAGHGGSGHDALEMLRRAPDGATGDSAAVDPFVAGAALVDALGELQQQGPLVVAVDDAHWADRPSLLALTFAIRRLHRDRVLVLLTLRGTDQAALPEGFRRTLENDAATWLRLSGLSSADIAQFGSHVGGEPLSPRAAARLRDHTDGNPLHAWALLEQVPVESLERSGAALPAPRSFDLLVLGRLAACTTSTRDFVAAASVLGRCSALQEIARLSEATAPLDALDEASDRGLLRSSHSGRSVEFAHPLLQAAVYQHLGASERHALHRRAASHVAGESERLRHRARAAIGPDKALARDLADFAHRQMVIGAWSLGAEHLTAAAELAAGTTLGDQLVAEAADCQLMSGDAGDLSDLRVRLGALPATPWRDYVLARLAIAVGDLEEAEPLLLQAWRRCEAGTDGPLKTRIAGQLGWLYVARDCGADAVEWSERSLRLGEDRGSTDVSRLIHVVSLGMCGRTIDALASVGHPAEPAVASAAELDAIVGRARVRSWCDDFAGAHRDLSGVLAAAAGRSVTFQMAAAGVLGEVEYWIGRWDNAVVHSSLAVSLAADAEQAWLIAVCEAVASFVPSARGDWGRASQHIDAAAQHLMHPGHAVAQAYLASARAHLAAASNDPAAVIGALLPLSSRDDDSSVFEPGVIMRWQDLLVEALASEGRFAEAETVLGRFAARAGARQRRSALAAAARARGNLFAAHNKVEQAMAAFDTGLRHLSAVDMPFDQGRLHLAAGACLRRSGKRNAAAEHLRAATASFQRLGAKPYLERADRELAACGHHAARRAHAEEFQLTAQEFAVAHLAAQGLTNKHIARELVISTKTVEYHLSHVYSKLGLTSRVQLARRLSRD